VLNTLEPDLHAHAELSQVSHSPCISTGIHGADGVEQFLMQKVLSR